MPSDPIIQKAVLDAIADVNLQLSEEEQVLVALDALLFGSGGRFDSLSLVNFATSVEERLQASGKPSLNLLEDASFFEGMQNLGSAQSFVDFVEAKLSRPASK